MLSLFDLIVRCPCHVSFKVISTRDEMLHMLKLRKLADEMSVEASCSINVDRPIKECTVKISQD